MINKRQEGNEGEDLAVKLLTSKGYEIIERNYHFGNKGEIDIIALDPETGYTVFVEVKLKKNLNFGEPEYSITKKKIGQLKRVAMGYLFEREMKELSCRFDVIAILMIPKQDTKIEHYINAFD
ncbi:MAG: YraN family protein [Ignavibacteriaceae bacterium]